MLGERWRRSKLAFPCFSTHLRGSAVDIGSGVQLTFNSIYLESPSDNNGFLVRRIAAQHVSADLDCCDPGQDIPEEISDYEFMVHTARANGPAMEVPRIFGSLLRLDLHLPRVSKGCSFHISHP